MNIRLLRADEIDVRIGGFNKEKTGGFLLLYKDARVDMTILDETFGICGWKRKHEIINGNLFCTISIYNKETKEWIGKQDVGVESNEDATKGQASDSFKRAGFNVGIGRELYTAPFIWINGLQKYDKFKVSEIDYKQNREISKLVIVDNKGKTAYKFGNTYTKSKNNASKKTYQQKAKVDKDKQAIVDGSLASEAQVKYIANLLKKKNYTDSSTKEYLKKTYNKDDVKALNKKEAGQLINMLNEI